MTLRLSEFSFIPENYDKLNNIFNEIINLRKFDKQNYTQIIKDFINTNIISDDEMFIRDLADKYLSKIGLKQNKNYCMIEYLRHRLNCEKSRYPFTKHNDSFGYLNCNVNTCIFYIRKDKTFNGGDLDIFGL